MRTAINVQQLPEAGPRLPPPTMAASRPVLLHQAGRLQRLLHPAVGHRHPVLPRDDLVKVSDIEARIALAIEPQHPLDFARRDWRARRTEWSRLSTNPAYPCASYRCRHRRNVRGDHPMTSAARNQ